MLGPSVRTCNKDYLNCDFLGGDGRHSIHSSTAFFAPQCRANFGTLRAMIGESTQPAHDLGNVAG